MARVLVTGSTGFIASHTILRLLEAGHEVRGTARSAERAAALNATLSRYAGRDIAIDIVAADLTGDDGWAEAMDAFKGATSYEAPASSSALSRDAMSKYESPLTRTPSEAVSITDAEKLAPQVASASERARNVMAAVAVD